MGRGRGGPHRRHTCRRGGAVGELRRRVTGHCRAHRFTYRRGAHGEDLL